MDLSAFLNTRTHQLLHLYVVAGEVLSAAAATALLGATLPAEDHLAGAEAAPAWDLNAVAAEPHPTCFTARWCIVTAPTIVLLLEMLQLVPTVLMVAVGVAAEVAAVFKVRTALSLVPSSQANIATFRLLPV
jgi:hypothetical protein